MFVAGGAIQTPALLRRSGIKHNVGESLRMHPTVKVVARFDDVVNAPGMGVPVHQVKEFAPHLSFGCSISEPPHLALAMTDHPEQVAEVHEQWPHLAVYYAMSDGGAGRVRTVPALPRPAGDRSRSTSADLALLADGLEKLCRCLLAAGATALYPSIRGGPPICSEADLGAAAALPAARPHEPDDHPLLLDLSDGREPGAHRGRLARPRARRQRAARRGRLAAVRRRPA